MKVHYRDEEWELQGQRTVREAIEEVGLTPETVLAMREGELVGDDVVLDEDDEIRILAVISGG